MKKFLKPLCLLAAFMLVGWAPLSYGEESAAPRALENIGDILAWKSIRGASLSPDGSWMGYMLAPQEGDAEIIFRQVEGEKELKFPAGEPPRYGAAPYAFSPDSRWAAYTVFPTRDEARKLRKQKKPLQNKAVLIDLKTEKSYEFEDVKNFSFSGKNPGWIAFHRNPPASQKKGDDGWSGSDLILFDLATGSRLNLGNVSEFGFNKPGTLLAWIVDSQGKSGNGVQLRNLKSGVTTAVDSGEAVYKKLSWNEKGDGLAVLRGEEDEAFENPLFRVIGFTGFDAKPPEKTVYDPHADKAFPENMTISPNRAPMWTDDFGGILFGIHELEEKKDAKIKPAEKPEGDAEPPEKTEPSEKEIDEEDLPDLVIWHWADKRLQAMQKVQGNRDKNYSSLCIYRVKQKAFIRLADDTLREVSPAPKHRWAIGYDNRAYELDGNLYGRYFNDLFIIDLQTGERRPSLKKIRWSYTPSPDGERLLFFRDGHFHTLELATGKTANITEGMPTSFINTEDDHNVVDPPIAPYRFGWTSDSRSVLLYDNWDVWQVPVDGHPAVNLTVDGKDKQIRYQSRFRLDPEEKGIDMSRPLYLSIYGEWTKKGGIGRISKGKPGVKRLQWDDAAFSMIKAEKADVFLATRQTWKDYPDYYVADSDLKFGKRLTRANPQQKDYLWSSGVKLVDYQSAKGDRLQAALFLPANYEAGKSYPTLIYYYEKTSQRLNYYSPPAARGFNQTVYTSRGYAVLMPDIVYTINDPGMSAVWCVLPAVKAAAATGVVDIERTGIHGHSWGGYQTAFLITQTDMFKAAVAGAPLTNMISMYSSVYWNSGSANQPIFESSQGRFKGNFLDNLDAYARNSPVYYADRVKTPLMILHNDADGAVDWNQGIEYFNTLRQLKKSVIMLQYVGENHGLRKPPNLKDYYMRMMEFFDFHLRGKDAPDWMTKGVSHLDHKQHIEDRTRAVLKQMEKKTEPADKEKTTRK